MITYGAYNPQNYLTSALTLYNQLDKTIKFLRVQNNSPYQLDVSIDGLITHVSEFWQKDVPIPPYSQGNLTVTPVLVITSASHAQAYQFTLQGLTALDGGGSLDGAMPQQAVNSTATGNPLFTAKFGVGSSSGAVQTLNIYNPATSGVDMIFHSARAFTNSPGVPQGVMTYISGADLNLPTAVSATPHTLQANAPVSAAHCTFDDGSGHGGTPIETVRLPGSTTNGTLDMLDFPDTVTLTPGTNLLLVCSDSSSGHVVELGLKWSEQAAIPAPNNGSVPILTAANIVNDGNAIGTGLIEATPTGTTQTIYATNDGQLTWKINQSGVLHQVLKTLTAGNPLQIGQAGDNTELLGVLLADQGMNTNTIRDGTNGNAALDLSLGTGEVQLPQPLHTNSSNNAHNGSVAGSVNFYTPIWGTSFKVLLVTFGGYNSASNFSFTLPLTIGRGLWFSSYNGSSTCAFGSVDVATGLGSGTARGGDIGETQIFANSFGSIQVTSATTFTVNSTGGVAVNGAVLAIGV